VEVRNEKDRASLFVAINAFAQVKDYRQIKAPAVRSFSMPRPKRIRHLRSSERTCHRITLDDRSRMKLPRRFRRCRQRHAPHPRRRDRVEAE
jgi:hypothetical protein